MQRFIWRAWKVLIGRGEDKSPAKALFAYSILYLFAIFAALLVDTIAARCMSPRAGSGGSLMERGPRRPVRVSDRPSDRR